MSRVPVMVLGATGLVGQRLVQLLDDHPQFSLAEVAGSSGRAGQAYGESVRWALESGPPESAMSVQLSDPWKVPRSRLVLSALPATAA